MSAEIQAGGETQLEGAADTDGLFSTMTSSESNMALPHCVFQFLENIP